MKNVLSRVFKRLYFLNLNNNGRSLFSHISTKLHFLNQNGQKEVFYKCICIRVNMVSERNNTVSEIIITENAISHLLLAKIEFWNQATKARHHDIMDKRWEAPSICSSVYWGTSPLCLSHPAGWQCLQNMMWTKIRLTLFLWYSFLLRYFSMTVGIVNYIHNGRGLWKTGCHPKMYCLLCPKILYKI